MEENTRDYEAEARSEGWVPQEEWNGPDEKWVDAKTFVDRGEKIAGILKSKVSRLEEDIARLNESNKKFGEYHRSQIQREHEKNQKLIKELEALRKQAISEGDGDAFDRADRQLTELRQQQRLEPDAGTSQKLAEAWLSENQWYQTNRKLGAYADGIAERVIAEGYTGKAYFDELTRRVKQDFPEEFGNKRRSGSPDVEGGGDREVTNSKSKTYSNLPADAKAACDRFVRDGFMTKEDFVAQYEWE